MLGGEREIPTTLCPRERELVDNRSSALSFRAENGDSEVRRHYALFQCFRASSTFAVAATSLEFADSQLLARSRDENLK